MRGVLIEGMAEKKRVLRHQGSQSCLMLMLILQCLDRSDSLTKEPEEQEERIREEGVSLRGIAALLSR